MRVTHWTRIGLASLALIAVTSSGIAEAGSCAKEAKVEEANANKPLYALVQSSGFKTLGAAIEATGLQQTLNTGGPFTVFAPTDEAFAKLPEGTLETLLANPDQLKKILLYHVVDGTVLAANVVKLTEATTLNGAKVLINAKSGVVLNGSTNVVKTDVMAKTGVVHVIDTVLLPPQ